MDSGNDDPDLQAIRARRLAELQQQQQQQSRQPGNAAADAQRQNEKEEEARNSILTQILSQEAGARRKLFPPFLKNSRISNAIFFLYQNDCSKYSESSEAGKSEAGRRHTN